MQPPHARNADSQQKSEEAKNRFSTEPLMSDFWPPELLENRFLCEKSSHFVVVVRATTRNEYTLVIPPGKE